MASDLVPSFFPLSSNLPEDSLSLLRDRHSALLGSLPSVEWRRSNDLVVKVPKAGGEEGQCVIS